MKISELTEKLNWFSVTKGDLDVMIYDDMAPEDFCEPELAVTRNNEKEFLLIS
jgi:hypothetical protein